MASGRQVPFNESTNALRHCYLLESLRDFQHPYSFVSTYFLLSRGPSANSGCKLIILMRGIKAELDWHRWPCDIQLPNGLSVGRGSAYRCIEHRASKYLTARLPFHVAWSLVAWESHRVGRHGEAICIDNRSTFRGNGKATWLESCKQAQKQGRIWRAVDPEWNQQASTCS